MQHSQNPLPQLQLRTLLAMALLALPSLAHAQFGVTDEQFDSIQAVRDSMEIVLGETHVTAKKRTVKAEVDKLTYSVADDAEAQTQTLTEVLRKVPMVTVDGEDNVKLKGQSNFKVYVNGKPNQMMTKNPKEIFKAYPAAAVKKIEVITDPGARYDAEGVAGVLNIVTFEGTQSKGWTITPRTSVRRDMNDAGFFGTMQYGKFTLSANYGFGLSKRMQPVRQTSEVEYLNSDVYRKLTTRAEAAPDLFYNFGSLEASYEVSDHDLLSLSAGIFGHSYDFDCIGTIVMTGIDGAPAYSYKTQTAQHNSYMGYNAGIDYQHTFAKPEQTLTFSYRFDGAPQKSWQKNEYFDIEGSVLPTSLTDIYSDPDNHSCEHTAQADFTTPFARHHQLSVGGKYIVRTNESDSRQWEKPSESVGQDAWNFDDEASLHYRHRNGIAAAYAEYMLKIKQFSLRTGVRFEHSHVEVSYPDGKRQGFGRNFDNWVPSVNLAYNLSPMQMLKLSYAYRIGRPNITQLSPYVNTAMAGFRTYGNPLLESEGAHQVGANYSFYGQKFSISVDASFNTSDNGLVSYSFIDRSHCIHTTYDNFLEHRIGNLSGFISWNITPHTVVTVNGSGSYSHFSVDKGVAATETHDAFRVSQHNSGWSGYAFADFRQDLWWHLKLGLSGGGGAPDVSLQGKGDGWYFYNLTLSRSFLKDDRLHVSANVGNFLPRHRSYSQRSEGEGFVSTQTQRQDQLTFGLSVSWRFGKLQTSVKKARRSIQNDDVAKSQGSGQQGGGGKQGMP